jgi:hypothetical protein
MNVIIKIKLLILLILLSHISWGQQIEQLRVTLSKLANNEDSCCVYSVIVKNVSDSTVCILHSIFLNLTSNKPQGIAVYQQGKSKVQYSLRYSLSDTAYNFESVPYRAECILPYQTLSFKIIIADTLNEKTKYLNFEYLYTPDFCYKNFMKDMRKMTSWYIKYRRLEKTLELPKLRD